MANRRLALVLGLIVLLGAPDIALAQTGTRVEDQDKAVASAKTFMQLLKDFKFNTMWNERVSEFLKKRATQDAFVYSLSSGRAQVGALQTVKLFDVTYSTKDIPTGYVGDIYTVRFLNTYQAGNWFQIVTLIRDPDGQWRVSGLHEVQAPAD